MSRFVPLKALAGFNYVRPDAVIAVSAMEPTKCTVFMTGGVAIPANEPAKDVIARLNAAEAAQAQPQET